VPGPGRLWAGHLWAGHLWAGRLWGGGGGVGQRVVGRRSGHPQVPFSLPFAGRVMVVPAGAAPRAQPCSTWEAAAI
jgi:hypothetical protein